MAMNKLKTEACIPYATKLKITQNIIDTKGIVKKQCNNIYDFFTHHEHYIVAYNVGLYPSNLQEYDRISLYIAYNMSNNLKLY